MRIYKLICDLYEEFYRQVSLNPDFKYFPDSKGNKKDQLMICKFIKFLRKDYNQQYDINFLIDYFKFQFSHYAGVKTKYGTNAIMIHWIIGPTAIKRWQDRDVRKKWLVRVKLKSEVQLKLFKVYKQKLNNDFVTVYAYEEVDKMRYHNTENGFAYCRFMTTLYNPASSACKTCIFKDKCKTILQENHPKLYKLRIDE